MYKGIQIYTASENDSEALLEWRNDPLTREFSINTSLIKDSEHLRWLKQILENPLSIIYIGSLEGEKIGVCRFDCDPQISIAQISIILNPRFRGRHLSKLFLDASISEFYKKHCIPLIAKVKVVNMASSKCFTASGFDLIKEENGIAEYLFEKKAFNE